MTTKNVTYSYTTISSIDSGGENIIDNGYASFISGGDHNHIISPIGTSTQVDRSFIGGGIGNYIYEQCSSIVGGCQNAINAGGIGSFIGGGAGNTISGACSAILGGSGNTVTHNYASIFGNGLTSVADDTFHVSCVNAVNTPGTALGYPSGTIFRHTGGVLPPGALPLYIMP